MQASPRREVGGCRDPQTPIAEEPPMLGREEGPRAELGNSRAGKARTPPLPWAQHSPSHLPPAQWPGALVLGLLVVPSVTLGRHSLYTEATKRPLCDHQRSQSPRRRKASGVIASLIQRAGPPGSVSREFLCLFGVNSSNTNRTPVIHKMEA